MRRKPQTVLIHLTDMRMGAPRALTPLGKGGDLSCHANTEFDIDIALCII